MNHTVMSARPISTLWLILVVIAACCASDVELIENNRAVGSAVEEDAGLQIQSPGGSDLESVKRYGVASVSSARRQASASCVRSRMIQPDSAAGATSSPMGRLR
jgi:hypothetical protein